MHNIATERKYMDIILLENLLASLTPNLFITISMKGSKFNINLKLYVMALQGMLFFVASTYIYI